MIANMLVSLPMIGAIGLLAIAMLAAFLNSVSYPNGEAFYEFLSQICHQDFHKTFHLLGHPLGLCTRCTGGYLGVIIGAASVLFLVRPFRFVPILSAYSIGMTLFMIAVMDGILKVFDGNMERFFSGLVGGAGSALAFSSLIYLVFSLKRSS